MKRKFKIMVSIILMITMMITMYSFGDEEIIPLGDGGDNDISVYGKWNGDTLEIYRNTEADNDDGFIGRLDKEKFSEVIDRRPAPNGNIPNIFKNIEFIKNDNAKIIFPVDSSYLFQMIKGTVVFNDAITTEGVTNMEGMFKYCGFNDSVNLFDTSQVTNMKDMFYWAGNFNNGQTPQDGTVVPNNPITWNTTNVKDMSGIFAAAWKFDQNLNNLDMSNVNYMDSAFNGAQMFNNGQDPNVETPNQPLIWNTSNLESMNAMFVETFKFNQNLNSWDTSKVKIMSRVFASTLVFNNGDVPGESNNPLTWNTSNVETMLNLFTDAHAFNQELKDWDTSKVKNMMQMFAFTDKFNQDVSGLETDSLENAISMFYGASAIERIIMDTSNTQTVKARGFIQSNDNIVDIKFKNFSFTEGATSTGFNYEMIENQVFEVDGLVDYTRSEGTVLTENDFETDKVYHIFVPNFYITGDDYYEVYLNDELAVDAYGKEMRGRALSEPDYMENYKTRNVFRYAETELDENTFMAIKGMDLNGKATISGIKAMYRYDENKYNGTDDTWWVYVGSMTHELEPDSDGHQWYQKDYRGKDWMPVHVIYDVDGEPIPLYWQNNVWANTGWDFGWEQSDWPDGNPSIVEDGITWIWSDNYLVKYKANQPVDPNDDIDTPVYLRNSNPNYSIVSYDSQGGSAVSSEKVYHGNKATRPSDPVRTNYSFNGWYLNGDLFDFDTVITEDITLTASWTLINNSDPGTGGNEVVFITPEETPLGKLNIKDHFAYVRGYPDRSVRPNANITRAEVSAIFFRLLDNKYKEEIRSNRNSFTDVLTSTWYNKHVSTLSNGKIIKGYKDGSFRPNNYITRAELAVIASRFDKLELNVKSPFSDTKGHWAEKYIASAAKKGWVSGYKNGTFKPDQKITRAEFMTFVNNVLGRHVMLDDILPGTIQFTDLTNKNVWFYNAVKVATNSYLYEKVKDEPGYQKWTKLIQPVIEM